MYFKRCQYVIQQLRVGQFTSTLSAEKNRKITSPSVQIVKRHALQVKQYSLRFGDYGLPSFSGDCDGLFDVHKIQRKNRISQSAASQHAFKSVYKSPFLSFCFVVEFAAVFSGKAIATNASGRTAEMGGIL
jgi:hypothetical protein